MKLDIKLFTGQYFENWRADFVAGLTIYLSISYIFFVTPTVLAGAGMNASSAFIATVVVSALCTFIFGVWAKLPFAAASVPTIAAYFAHYIVAKSGINLTWQQGMATVFFSGLIIIGMTHLSIRRNLLNSIPDGLKISILSSISVFVFINGLTICKIVSYKHGLIQVPDFNVIGYAPIVVFLTGMIVSIGLRTRLFKFSAAPLIGIIVAAVVSVKLGIKPPNINLQTNLFGGFFQVDFSKIGDIRFYSASFSFFLLDFYSSIGKFIGLSEATGKHVIFDDKKAIGRALYVDGAGSALSGLLGTTGVTVLVTSAVGTAAGGKTGLSAIICSIMILLTIAFLPIVSLIPVEASSGILAFVGFIVFPWSKVFGKNATNLAFDRTIAILSCFVITLTFSMGKAMAIGFIAYSILGIIDKSKKVNYYVLATTFILICSVMLEFYVS